MKFNRKLIAAFACLSVVFGACTDTPDVDCGVKANLTAPGSVTWDAGASSKTALALTWDASSAIAAGASSFTAQVVRPNMDTMEEGELHDFITPDQYSSSSVVLLATSNYLGSPNIDANETACDQILFDDLATGKQYMLRVRANYPGSNYSEWVWVTDEAGELAHIKVGKGIVAPTELDDKTPPVVKISYLSASEAIVTWSGSDWKNHPADFANAYKIILKKGNDLVVSWNIPANSGIWTVDSFNGCSFLLTALEPETEYNVLVQNVTEGTEPVSPTTFKTEASKVVTMPSAPANPGDVILYEDFSELFITSDLSRGAANYSYDQRGSMDSKEWIAKGEDPVANDVDGRGCYLVAPATEVGMFNTIKKYIAVTRLSQWGMMSEDNTNGAVCARAGHVKMGASSKCAWLVAPEINCLQQTATVELSFDAAVYDNWPHDASQGLDPGVIIVEVLNGCSQADNAGNSYVTPGDRMTAAVINLTEAWTRYTVSIDNINNGARLSIGGHRNGVDGQHRFYLDNIEIKVVSYGDLKLQAPKNVVVTPTDTTAEVTWDKVNSAEQYIVEYTNVCDACGQPIWTALPATAETKATIEGLSFETEYSVRIKAIAGDVQSEYCEPVAFKTLAEIKKLKTPKDVVVSAGLSWAVFDFPAVTKATSYEVYVKDATTPLESLVTVNDANKTVNVVVAGLELNSKYAFQLKALAPGSDMEASDLSEATAEITTGSFEQVKVNVGPTVATVGWNGCQKYFDFELEVSDASGKAMGTIALPDAKMTSELTDKASATQFGGTSSVYWKSEKAVPCRFTIGALTASTTYKVRVKPMGAPDAFYSPYFEVTTAAAHAAVANEVLFQSFDEMWYGGDYINCAAGLYPGDISTLPAPTWEGYIANAKYVLSLSSNTNVSASKLPKLMTAAEGYTLSGWSFANTDCRPSHCKLGGGSAPGTVITKELGTAVLKADAATKCTITMNVSPMSDGTACAAEAQVVVVHADGTETALDPISVFTTAEQSPWDFVWKKVEMKDVELKSTDKLKFTSVNSGTNSCRYLLDEILVVAQ
ncbi:MAG: fibronectin type III domain-containing protein [Alistipes sp.]|nr:fibronectin type III domain-containing protein [Alistipes sp.]